MLDCRADIGRYPIYHLTLVIQFVTLCYMRNIINISMPADMKKEVEAYVKEGQYASVSEFVRDMWRDYKRKKLIENVRASQKEFREGKGKLLKSLADLD